MTIVETFIKDKKFEGFLISHDNGDTQYLTIKEYKEYLKNKGIQSFIRLSDSDFYNKITIDLENFEISSQSTDEYFGWYNGTAIVLKK